ncbi:hypothetical protein [Collinsella sp. An307]|uniref:hypothetical protein n=1 Tax=Collinsella sp. An307 TaxID=1965630 RepID=UPI000B390CD5|nr:hypothetical protein [Collinsella sp. An307]OUO20081.1 hypothetical protein B5F89_06240 [Collinsella sp. An307]
MSILDRLIARASGSGASASSRGVTRRSFTIGSVAAIGAGMAAISLSSCGSSDVPEATGEPQVVDDSQLVAVLDGDYQSADCPYAAAQEFTLPLGTLLFHSGGSWAAALLTPESSTHVNTLGVMSLASGNLNTLIESPTLGGTYGFHDVRATDDVFAWVEVDYATREWALIAQGLSNGQLTGEPVELDHGDADWEPPRFTTWETSVIWQRMPLATGTARAEDSHCYQWTLGDTEGRELWTSHGRFAASPHVVDGILTITPRVNDDEGVYYGMTALDLTDGNLTRRDQLVLPSSVAPFEAIYMNEQFVFSIEASYSGRGSLGNMGTYIGREGGPYIFVRREPLACVVAKGTNYLVKAQTSHFVVDTEAETYATLLAPDRSVDFGDWPASEGVVDRFLSYATIRNDRGVPERVVARVFNL